MPDNGEHGPGTQIATVGRREARVLFTGDAGARKVAPRAPSRHAVPGVRSTRAPIGAPPTPHGVGLQDEEMVLREGKDENEEPETSEALM